MKRNIVIGLLVFVCLVLFLAEYVQKADSATTSFRVMLSATVDPATRQRIVWHAVSPVEKPVVQVVPWHPSPKFDEDAKTYDCAPVVRADLSADSKSSFYEVELTGLAPETTYGYRVGDGTLWSEWHRFRTAAQDTRPFHFIYLGDVQNDILSLGARTLREAYASCTDARMMVFAGDLVAEGYDDQLWGEFTDALGYIPAWIPVFSVPGNHDSHQPGTEEIAGPHDLYRAHFMFPDNGPQGLETLEEAAFYVDFQGVRFIALDGNVFANGDYLPAIREQAKEAQVEWLQGVLKNNPCLWTIVVVHQPLFSAGKDRDNAAMRNLLMPLLQEGNVDLVLQGHDHYYSRTYKVWDAQKVESTAPGIVYVTSVSGSKMYSKNPKFEHLMAVMRGETQMYQIVEVSSNELWFRAYAVGGELVDEFRLHKNADGTTNLQSVFPQ